LRLWAGEAELRVNTGEVEDRRALEQLARRSAPNVDEGEIVLHVDVADRRGENAGVGCEALDDVRGTHAAAPPRIEDQARHAALGRTAIGGGDGRPGRTGGGLKRELDGAGGDLQRAELLGELLGDETIWLAGAIA
jgi:hypothetical protein